MGGYAKSMQIYRNNNGDKRYLEIEFHNHKVSKNQVILCEIHILIYSMHWQISWRSGSDNSDLEFIHSIA